MKEIVKALTTILLFTALASAAAASDLPSKAKPSATPEMLEKGKAVYFKRCSFCHGLLGDGDGPAAYQLMPRPRDFTLGLYKFRTTQSGELPTDEDLFRTISRGIPGTAMQTFGGESGKNGLTEEQRWQVIYYIKTFFKGFTEPDSDPYKQVVKTAPKIQSSSESIEKGRKIFGEMKCWECHGESGTGNGPNAPKLKDKFRKDPILPFDLTKGWRYKAGNAADDIYMRFNTGLNGTPMPSFADSLKDEERWHLANYVVSLQKKEVLSASVLKAKFVSGDLPFTVDAPLWNSTEGIDVSLAGQVIANPRWENPSVELVGIKAVYNPTEIAFLMEWSDRFEDTLHKQELEYNVPPAYKGYLSWEDIPRKPGNFRDSIALQFPVTVSGGAKKPSFFRGDSSNPVNLWVWNADLAAQGKPGVEEAVARGFNQPLKAEAPEERQVLSKSAWKDGRWRVVMKRPLSTKDKNDIQFEKGQFIPFALNAWDGSNGEHGLIMSLSSWHYVFLETGTPAWVYIYAFMGIALTGFGEYWFILRKRKK
ncbi:MAG: c-type cytochrome [Deltaproteobacteria bacterium]|nr:c-type cytochrome [Deltaproteobacteria bacterium]